MDGLKRLKDFVATLTAFNFIPTARRALGNFSFTFSGEVLSYAYIKINKGAFELQTVDSVPCTLQTLQSVLEDLNDKFDLHKSSCSWLLTSDKYQLIQMEDLPVPAEEFQSAIRWQIKKLLSFPVEDALIDRFSIPVQNVNNPKKYIQLVVTQSSYIQPIADIIMASGINLTTIDIQELSLRNITALYETDDKSTALVYLQEKTSSITITKNKLFYFSRKLDWSLDLLTKANSIEQAHEYFDKLALELHRSFDFFQGQWRQPAPTRVLVAPVVTTIIDIAAYLSQRLTLTIQNLNLNSVLNSKITLDPTTQGEYLLLLGAALRQETDYVPAS